MAKKRVKSAESDSVSVVATNQAMAEADAGSEAIRKQGNPLLALFWDLASSDAATRKDVISRLLGHLSKAQESFVATVASHGPATEAPQAVQEQRLAVTQAARPLESKSLYEPSELDHVLASDVVYSVKRLIRGLGSSRTLARAGFSEALICVLEEVGTSIPPKIYLDWVFRLTLVTTGLKPREERDLYIGRMMGLAAAIRSSLLLGKSGAKADPEHAIVVYDELVQIGLRKSFLREPCLILILDMLRMASSSRVIRHVMEKLDGHKPSGDALAIAILLQKLHSVGKIGVFQEWPAEALLAPENLKAITELLGSCTQCHPRMHPVWRLVIENLGKGTFSPAQLWRAAVDHRLFNASSHEKKHLGFALVEPWASQIGLKDIFTSSFVRCLANNLARKDAPLHEAAAVVADRLVDAARADPSVAVLFLRKILAGNLAARFHRATGRDFVREIVGAYDAAGLEAFVKALVSFAKSAETDSKDEQDNKQLVWVSDQLLFLIKQQKPCDSDARWVRRILKFMSSKCLVESVDSRVRLAFDRLQSMLAELTSKPQVLGKLLAGEGSNDPVEWLQWTVNDAFFAKPAKKSFELFSEPLLKIARLVSADSEDRAMMAVRCTALYLALILPLDPSTVIPLIDELKSCQSKFKKSSRARAGPEPIEVLMDILLSILGRPSLLARRIVEIVLTLVAPLLTPAAVGLVLDIVKAPPGRSENELLEHHDSGDSEDELLLEDQSHPLPTDDAAIVTPPVSEEDEDSDLNDEDMEEFDLKLAQIFAQKKKQQDAKKGNGIRSSLINILIESRKMLVLFKFKAIDAAEIVLRRMSELQAETLLSMMHPLIEALKINMALVKNRRLEEQAQIARRLESLISTNVDRDIKTWPALTEEMVAAVSNKITELIDYIQSSPVPAESAKHIGKCIWFLRRWLEQAASDSYNASEFKSAHCKAWDEFITNGHGRFGAGFFSLAVHRDMALAMQMASSVTVERLEMLRPFRRNQVLGFVEEVLARSAASDKTDAVAAAVAQISACLTGFYEKYLVSSDFGGLKTIAVREELKRIAGFCKKSKAAAAKLAVAADWTPVASSLKRLAGLLDKPPKSLIDQASNLIKLIEK